MRKIEKYQREMGGGGEGGLLMALYFISWYLVLFIFSGQTFVRQAGIIIPEDFWGFPEYFKEFRADNFGFLKSIKKLAWLPPLWLLLIWKKMILNSQFPRAMGWRKKRHSMKYKTNIFVWYSHLSRTIFNTKNKKYLQFL